jgi:hypothetical protein
MLTAMATDGNKHGQVDMALSNLSTSSTIFAAFPVERCISDPA